MTIRLLDPGQEIPPAENILAAVEETPRTKRGRCRPPGAKNRPKIVKPVSELVPPPEEEEEEEKTEEPEEP